MKLRTGDPWMPASEYSHSLKGLTINLLVNNIERALDFQCQVLGATVIYSDPDFAVLSGFGSEWMMHADHTYEKHPMGALIHGLNTRGSGLELRLHGCDPDRCVAAARKNNYEVISSATDKRHGVREAYIRDADGYIWVPDVQI